jgi:hypothetical protein
MARRKDLTALAALGTLGYMLSKKGDKKDEKSTTAAAERRIAADKVASEEPLKVGSEFGMDPEEAANRRTERMLTNPNAREFGEAGTSMTVSPPTAPKPAARKPVVKSRPMSAAAEAAFQEANVAPSGSRYTSTKDFRGISDVPRRNSYYKKGGAVKGYASGGMTSSASKRADGIATKGKTRGKIC